VTRSGRGTEATRAGRGGGREAGATRAGRSTDAARSGRGGATGRAGTAAARGGRGTYNYHHRNSARYSHSSRPNHYYCHSSYSSCGWGVGFYFGAGLYWGFRCYWPSWNYCGGYGWGCFYSAPVSWCYMPYGFYWGYQPVYIQRVYVREEYPIQEYETAEETEESAAAQKGEVVEPKPAAGSPTIERYLRDGSEAFHEADYELAAEKFRLAAVSSPDQAAPLFAFGQALIALGKDRYAARVVRRAIDLDKTLLKQPGDIVGVYMNQEEFDRVLGELQERAAKSVAGSDSRYLVGVQQYFTGDPGARKTFDALAKDLPEDESVTLFRKAVEERFKAESDLPPLPEEK
jgi:hypothetical protein